MPREAFCRNRAVASPPGQVAARLEGSRLRVLLVRLPDRLQMVMEARAAAPPHNWETLFSSVEGDETDEWPPSPPLTALQLQEHPRGGQLALLVGQAGASHWSASVELQHDGQLVVDVACRAGGPAAGPGAAVLGSEYQLSPQVHSVTCTGRLAVIQWSGQRISLEAEGEPVAIMAGTRVPGAAVEFRPPDRLRIVPLAEQPNASVGGKRTIRWRYSVRVDE